MTEIEWLDIEINRLKDIIIKARLHNKAPCCICKYNGVNYFQPESHECMDRERELSHEQ